MSDEQERKPTRYVVLRNVTLTDEEGASVDAWVITPSEYDGHGQDAAKQRAAEDNGAATYAACPLSSWKVTPYGPRTVMVPLTGIDEGGGR